LYATFVGRTAMGYLERSLESPDQKPEVTVQESGDLAGGEPRANKITQFS
jgi:hypothetical protein